MVRFAWTTLNKQYNSHYSYRETKAQNFLIAIIVGAIFVFILGAVMGPSNDVQKAQGFVGFSCE